MSLMPVTLIFVRRIAVSLSVVEHGWQHRARSRWAHHHGG
jgi:hypothetical protein